MISDSGDNKNLQSNNKRLRVKRLKKIIVSVFVVMLMTTTALCALAFLRVSQLQDELDKYIIKEEMFEVSNEKNLTYSNPLSPTGNSNEPKVLVNPSINSIYDYQFSDNDQLMNDYISENIEKSNKSPYDNMIKVYLTFDDGPSANTNNILDVLAEYGVKATFFVNGHEGYENQYIRIVEEGHTIAMHSFSHSYKDVYKDLDSFADDLYKIQSYIMDLTGVNCTFYRFPGGSSNTVCRVSMKDCIDYLNAKGIRYYDWNVAGNDAVVNGASVNTIVNNVIGQIASCEDDTIIILLHDSGDKSTTVEALPIIIEKIANMDNVVLLPITDDTKPIHHILY